VPAPWLGGPKRKLGGPNQFPSAYQLQVMSGDLIFITGHWVFETAPITTGCSSDAVLDPSIRAQHVQRTSSFKGLRGTSPPTGKRIAGKFVLWAMDVASGGLLELADLAQEGHQLEYVHQGRRGVTLLTSVISLILIPGIGTPSVYDWAVKSAEWRERLHSWNVVSRTFVFEHNISLGAQFGWEQLEIAGSELQEAIVELCDHYEVGTLQRILFIKDCSDSGPRIASDP
jgi:hypothetical protein